MKYITKPQQNQIQSLSNYQQTLQMLRLMFPTLMKVDDDVLITAIAHAKYLGLDPLKREVHFVPYYNKDTGKTVVQLVVAYTEYIKRAERSGKLKGWSCKVEKREDDYYAVVVIKRADWNMDFVWEVPLKEAIKDTPSWKAQPLFMLRKTAISQAFRMCFPEETSYLPYTVEETELSPELTAPVQELSPIQEPVPELPGEPHPAVKLISDKQRRYLFVKARELGLTDDEVKEVITQKFGYESTKDIPANIFDHVLYALEKYAQQKQSPAPEENQPTVPEEFENFSEEVEL